MATLDKTSWKYVGAAALTGGEALKWTAKGECDMATLLTDKPIGWAAEACAIGNVTAQNIGVWPISGKFSTVQAIASAAITAGDYVTATTAGRMVTTAAKATYEASVVEWIWGYANEAAGVAGEVIEIVVCATSQSQ